MQDAETKTLWNHITGEAVYGPLAGRTVGPPANLLHMTVKEALEMDPRTRVAISDRPYVAGGRRFGTPAPGPGPIGGSRSGAGRSSRESPNRTMSERFAATLGAEDLRRPRMDIGLGVWTETTHRYYPLERIRERDDAFLDRIDGRTVLIYVDPLSNIPAAVFVETTNVRWDGPMLRLDDGSTVGAGRIVSRDGGPVPVQRPRQMFTRWYGFSLTFPGSDVFGE